jgi:enamine deaminase RidA (YjgF/YER057c/UK114 family)
MIIRLPGSVPTRSRAVVHNGIVHAVAVSPEKVPSTHEQTRRALIAIDRALADAGTDKTRIITATVYIADMAQKPAMNQAWDEWVSLLDPPLRACLGVALEGQDLVEILVTAALPEASG